MKKFTTKDMIIGLEVETWLDTDMYDMEYGLYHDGRNVSQHWETQNDSSIEPRESCPFADCYYDEEDDEYHNEDDTNNDVEFVSKAFKFSKFDTVIAELKDLLYIEGKELYQTVHLNETMGTHVHFSPPKGSFKNFGDRGRMKFYKMMRESFKWRIGRSNISSKDKIIERYNRYYAQQIEDLKNRSKRQVEFNFLSESDGKGLEWRSPNMGDIKTWREFDEYFKIIKACLNDIGRYNFNFTLKRVKEIKYDLSDRYNTVIKINVKNKKLVLKEKIVFKNKENIKVGGKKCVM